MPFSPRPVGFAKSSSGCSQYRRKVGVVAGSDHNKTMENVAIQQGLEGSGHTWRSGGDILGWRSSSDKREIVFLLVKTR